jgi:site-specific DNA recombinase
VRSSRGKGSNPQQCGRCEPKRERFSSTPCATPNRWIDELTTDSTRSIAAVAARESKTERSIRMTMSLAFLSPTLVKAAIEGRLPRGFGVKRLMDLPMAWSDQWSALGLKAPALP